MVRTGPTERVRYGDVFRIGEFRVLWLAQAQSLVGDQLARLALAVLVFGETSSAVLTALTYSLTFLPALVTAPFLSGLADRHPRRTVMAAADAARGALVALMVIPGVPLPVMMVLLVAMVCLQPLFAGARNATLPTVLTGDRYQVGMGIVAMTDYFAQIAGFVAGGALIGVLGGPRTALALDAVTYLASAALVRFGIRPHRPSAEAGEPGGAGRWPALAGIRLLVRDRRLVGLAGLIWLYGFFIAPEALAAPYAAELGAGTLAVGLLMAADPAGAFAGTMLITRLVPPGPRQRLMVPLALLTGTPLVLSAIAPSLPVSLALWVVNGALTAYIVLAQARFVTAVPDTVRARAIGAASAGLQTAQGLGVLLAGALAEATRPSVAVAVCGAAGTLGAAVLALVCRPDRAEPVE